MVQMPEEMEHLSDLIYKLLQTEEQERLDVKKALNHPFLTQAIDKNIRLNVEVHKKTKRSLLQLQLQDELKGILSFFLNNEGVERNIETIFSA